MIANKLKDIKVLQGALFDLMGAKNAIKRVLAGQRLISGI